MSTNDYPKLRSCPFCGGEAEPGLLGLVFCPDCGATIDVNNWNNRTERTCHNINDPMKSGELGFKCSVCGHWDEWQQPNFCPNCGAKVVE